MGKSVFSEQRFSKWVCEAKGDKRATNCEIDLSKMCEHALISHMKSRKQKIFKSMGQMDATVNSPGIFWKPVGILKTITCGDSRLIDYVDSMDVLKDKTNTINTPPCQCSVLTTDDIPGALLTKETEKCKKSELEFWLKCRGLKVKKSETKAQLCDRVRRCQESPSAYTIVDPDPGKCHLLRKQSMCTNCSTLPLNQLPLTNHSSKESTTELSKCLPKDGWNRATNCLPMSFSHMNLTQHAKTSGKNQTYVEKPIEKGYRFFWDGYVHNVQCTSVNSETYVKAKCFRSQRKHELPHILSVKLDKHSGNVIAGHCSCVAGATGYCNHIFALLYAVDHVKKMNISEFPIHSTCTSKPAEWSKTRNDGVSAEPIMDCHIVKPKYSHNSSGIQSTLYDPRSSSLASGKSAMSSVQLFDSLGQLDTNLGINSVLNLEECLTVKTRMGFLAPVGSVLSYQLSLTESNFKVHENISSDFNQYNIVDFPLDLPAFPWKSIECSETDLEINTNLYQDLHIQLSADSCIELEKETRDQNQSLRWFEERKKRLTASNFGLVLNRKSKNNEQFIKNTLIGKKDLSHVTAIKYGLDNEERAVQQYLKYMNRSRNHVACFKSGFVVNSDFPWVGASPDRKVFDAKYGFGLLEIKCPYKMKDVIPINACDDPTFFCEIIANGSPRLKRNHHYYAQVQGQLGVCGASWCDFVVYTKKGLIIERIPFNEKFWCDMMIKLNDFYEKYMIPVITNTVS